ncbi:hypothetical protein [Marinobacter sp.]|uniref:hypothetical protein n=1 Tax=Marinobacter sp. TaxID=50741 RepID=UPI0035622087
MKKQLLALAAVLLLASCSTHAEQSPEDLNAEALQLMHSGADQQELERVLELTGKAIELDRAYLPARSVRINALIQLGKLDRVVQEAEEMASIDNSPENLLYACMAQEMANPGYPGQQLCYSDIAGQMEGDGRSPETDASLLMALKLANNAGFESAVWDYIENQESEAAREVAEYLFIERSRDEVLNSYFSP